MNINSIITKITLIFVFAIILLVAVFFFYLKYEKEQNVKMVINYHEKNANYVFKNKMPPRDAVEYFERQNFKLEQNHREVLHNAMILIGKRDFETILYKNEYYFHLLTPRFRLLFKDLTLYKVDYSAYYLFAIFTIFLIIIYMWLINSLKPLHVLKNQITQFAKGDLNIDCSSDKKDEIADVANEFDKAVKEIDLLLHSRQLFLRTVMHELKTPIAKGRIVSELVDSDKQKDRLILIFEKLDYLINDFAKVEQVVSKNYKVNRQKFNLEQILNNSINMLMLENTKEKIIIDIKSNHDLQIDFDLISMAMKNLIDNALKYSIYGKVIIKEEKNRLLFISKGEPLKKTLNEYFKPFHNDTKSKNHGMGLGLYIVKSILDIHGMHFEHEHATEENIFKISLVEK